MAKNQEELAGEHLPATTPSDLLHIPQGFNWQMATARALKHALYRETRKLQINPDTRIAYPNECRTTNLDSHECHPETKKRILKKHISTLEKSMVPIVERPRRMNKNG